MWASAQLTRHGSQPFKEAHPPACLHICCILPAASVQRDWELSASVSAQAVPMYLSEVAPASWRGALNICFQMSTTIGILLANCINFGESLTVHHQSNSPSRTVPGLL